MSGTGIVESLEIRDFLFVVVVRHRDEQRVTETDPLEHKRLHGSGSATIAVEKWVQRRKVVVQSERLDEWVVLVEDRACGLDELAQRLGAFVSTLPTPVARRAEGDILIAAAESTRGAMVVVAACDEPAVHLHG